MGDLSFNICNQNNSEEPRKNNSVVIVLKSAIMCKHRSSAYIVLLILCPTAFPKFRNWHFFIKFKNNWLTTSQVLGTGRRSEPFLATFERYTATHNYTHHTCMLCIKCVVIWRIVQTVIHFDIRPYLLLLLMPNVYSPGLSSFLVDNIDQALQCSSNICVVADLNLLSWIYKVIQPCSSTFRDLLVSVVFALW